jgi:hypothetical protein
MNRGSFPAGARRGLKKPAFAHAARTMQVKTGYSIAPRLAGGQSRQGMGDYGRLRGKKRELFLFCFNFLDILTLLETNMHETWNSHSHP